MSLIWFDQQWSTIRIRSFPEITYPSFFPFISVLPVVYCKSIQQYSSQTCCLLVSLCVLWKAPLYSFAVSVKKNEGRSLTVEAFSCEWLVVSKSQPAGGILPFPAARSFCNKVEGSIVWTRGNFPVIGLGKTRMCDLLFSRIEHINHVTADLSNPRSLLAARLLHLFVSFFYGALIF